PNGEAAVTEVTVRGRRLAARVVASAPALIATSQPAIPGWRARVDGEPAALVETDGAFLGLLVGPGDHRVEVVYAPASWRWGLVACALGVLVAAFLLRRRSGHGGLSGVAIP
ncbi:MAG: YfhO family protein, partial [Acidobacteria bacterium]|nr:YfhO family protein [Acidobacteriota bacterium]